VVRVSRRHLRTDRNTHLPNLIETRTIPAMSAVIHANQPYAEDPEIRREMLILAELLLDIYKFRQRMASDQKTEEVDSGPRIGRMKRERSKNKFALG